MAFVYRDHGSVVSLGRSLYRMHILAIHGWIRGMSLIVTGHVNRIVRPRLDLHRDPARPASECARLPPR